VGTLCFEGGAQEALRIVRRDIPAQASIGASLISGLLVILLGELLLVRESLAKNTSICRRVMVFDRYRYRYREEDEATANPTIAESL